MIIVGLGEKKKYILHGFTADLKFFSLGGDR